MFCSRNEYIAEENVRDVADEGLWTMRLGDAKMFANGAVDFVEGRKRVRTRAGRPQTSNRRKPTGRAKIRCSKIAAWWILRPAEDN